MDNDQPTPRQVLLNILDMYGDPTARKHISMKRMMREYRKDLLLYGSLSQKQFASIIQYLE